MMLNTLKLTLNGVEVGVLINPRVPDKGSIRADRVDFRMDRFPCFSDLLHGLVKLQLEADPPFAVHLAGYGDAELRDNGDCMICLFPWLERVQGV